MKFKILIHLDDGRIVEFLSLKDSLFCSIEAAEKAFIKGKHARGLLKFAPQ